MYVCGCLPSYDQSSAPSVEQQGNTEVVLEMDRRDYRLTIGNTIIAIEVDPPKYRSVLEAYFARPNTAETPHFRLQVHLVRKHGTLSVPESLFTSKQASPDHFVIADGLVHGRMEGSAAAETWVDRRLLSGNLIRVFEQLIYQAFYSAARLHEASGVLLHSSGVIRDGKGMVFVGPSEAGKSTIAAMSKDAQVLNDEICLLQFAGSSIQLWDTPFNGFFQDKVQGTAPLSAVFLLSHKDADRVVPAVQKAAVSGILQQIVPPIGLSETIEKHTLENMLEAALRILQNAPVYELRFTLAGGFWIEIDRFLSEEKK
jgi:hypothetical protein